MAAKGPQAAQRWVDTKTELTTRRVLTRSSYTLLASDGAAKPPASRPPALPGLPGGRASAAAAALDRVTAHIFSDPEQAALLGNTFRVEPSAPRPASTLDSARIALELQRGDTSQEQLADSFRAVRLWAPHRVLSQFVLDTCRASLQLEPEPEPAGDPRDYPGGSGLLKRQRLSPQEPHSRPAPRRPLPWLLRPSSTVLELNAGTGVCGIFASHGLAAIDTCHPMENPHDLKSPQGAALAGRVILAERCKVALQLLQLNAGLSSTHEHISVCELLSDPDSERSEEAQSKTALLRGVGVGDVPPVCGTVDAVISVLDPFDDEVSFGVSTFRNPHSI